MIRFPQVRFFPILNINAQNGQIDCQTGNCQYDNCQFCTYRSYCLSERCMSTKQLKAPLSFLRIDNFKGIVSIEKMKVSTL
jgi:hypothetical protein